MDEEETKQVVESLGLDKESLQDLLVELDSASSSSSQQQQQQDLTITRKNYYPYGLGCVLLVNFSILLSVLPAVGGRGAPYLPTFKKNLDAMFHQLRTESDILKRTTKSGGGTTTTTTKRTKLRFVDLGSGDGRIIFRAAREGYFDKSIGYELNPVLHMFAQARRLLQAPKYWSSTKFVLQDIWRVDLRKADVVVVYGLNPIMNQLAIKLRKELKPGSVVVSNVFSLPGWKPVSTSPQGTHMYVVDPKYYYCNKTNNKKTLSSFPLSPTGGNGGH